MAGRWGRGPVEALIRNIVSSQDAAAGDGSNQRSVGDWMSEVSESRRWKEPYGLLSSSSHMVLFLALQGVAGPSKGEAARRFGSVTELFIGHHKFNVVVGCCAVFACLLLSELPLWLV